MRKIGCLVLCLIICISSFATVSANTQTVYSRVYNSSGKEVFSYEVDTTDSRNGIQKCFDFINNLKDDETYMVVLDNAIYNMGSSLNIYSNTIFNLNGSTIRRGNENCSALLRFGRSDEVHYGYDGFKNITVKNGSFDAAKLNNVSMVRFAHAKNIVFDSVSFRNTVGTYHMMTFAACADVVVNNCGFYDMNLEGLSDSTNGEALQIDILRDGHFTYPAQDFTSTKNVKVTNCTFKNVGRGVGTHSAVSGHYFNNMEFSNNTFENVIGYAIKTVNYRNSKIVNNKMINCGSGIFVGNMTNEGCSNFYESFNNASKINSNANVSIEKNDINLIDTKYNNSAFGIRIFGKKITTKDNKRYVGDFRISGVKINNNTIKSKIAKKSYHGIWLQGVVNRNDKNVYVKVTNNTLKCTSKTTSNKALYGVRIEGSSNVELKKNSVHGSSKTVPGLKSCLYVSDSNNIKMQYNHFENSKSFGVKFSDVANSSFENNKIKNTKNNALYVMSGCKKFNVVSNTISNSSAYGIVALESSGKNITKNTLSDIKNHAIYVKNNASYENVSSNYIYNVKSIAIYLNSNANVTKINDNIIDMASAKKNAIQLNDKSKAKYINNNKINQKTKSTSKKIKVKILNGIAVKSNAGSVSQISNNKIKGCVESGILVTATKPKPTFKKNVISSCKYGIKYRKGKLSSNKITKAKSAKTYKY